MMASCCALAQKRRVSCFRGLLMRTPITSLFVKYIRTYCAGWGRASVGASASRWPAEVSAALAALPAPAVQGYLAHRKKPPP